ncbi:hypothetical protein ACSV9I_02845 [Rhizobium sp. G187]|uniref:hypothetical protein n=1 Tax=Rhizobium sp. G187 TaxID=3451352 RepID=UPI003EE79153
MPKLDTANGPNAEMLDLRMMRNMVALARYPATCRTRQCRRSGHCMGRVTPLGEPIWRATELPPCIHGVDATFVRQQAVVSRVIMDFIYGSEAREPWPADPDKAERLRHSMALLQQVHARPGLHPDRERAGLRAWLRRDPDPKQFARICSSLR